MADSNRMTIPQIRKRIKELADEHGIEELHSLADQMHRQKIKKTRAPITSQKMTPELAAEMRTFLTNNPTASNQAVANHFTVNPGRMTDALKKT